MSTDIVARIARLYAAVDDTAEMDLSKFSPVTNPSGTYFRMDFRGGMTEAEMANCAHTAVAQVASLRDHLKRWAKRVLMDVWTHDKHGGEPRETWSGKAPRLVDVDRGLRVSPKSGKAVALTQSATGLTVHGDPAYLAVALIGTVIDADGALLGDLMQLLDDGVEAWEDLLREWGLL